MRFAVVGHVEWVDFLEVSHVPLAGEIVNAAAAWSEAAGGGAVAAVQLAKLAGTVTFFTALGGDELGRRAEAQLREQDVEVAAARREVAQRRAVTFLDQRGERTITTIGPRLVPTAEDDLPWDLLDDVDGVYFTGGDAGALRHARRARVVVATPRAKDALVRSAADAGEQGDPERLGYSARLIVNTEGPQGGTFVAGEGRTGTFKAAALPGPLADAYGAGDSFAAGLTFGLGSGLGIEAALHVAASCGAGNMSGRGPYSGQPLREDLELPPEPDRL